MDKIRWGIIGPGSIAHNFADALKQFYSGELIAIDSIEWVDGEVEVINFDVEPLDIYFAGGVLVHNKGADSEP